MALRVVLPALLGLAAGGPASALELGGYTLSSARGEPLRVEVGLSDTRGLSPNEVRVRIFSRGHFDGAEVSEDYFRTISNLRYRLGTRGGDIERLHITTAQPVFEPLLNFLVEVRWAGGRTRQEYSIALAAPAVAAAVAASPGPGVSIETAQPPRLITAPRPPDELTANLLRPVSDPSLNDNRPLSATPRPGTRYRVRETDTLWNISSRGRPLGPSVQQTMLDTQRLNPDAFRAGNINGLRLGYLLRLPTFEEISDLDIGAAQAEVRRQNRLWREIAPTLLGESGAREPEAWEPDVWDASPRPTGPATGVPSGDVWDDARDDPRGGNKSDSQPSLPATGSPSGDDLVVPLDGNDSQPGSLYDDTLPGNDDGASAAPSADEPGAGAETGVSTGADAKPKGLPPGASLLETIGHHLSQDYLGLGCLRLDLPGLPECVLYIHLLYALAALALLLLLYEVLRPRRRRGGDSHYDTKYDTHYDTDYASPGHGEHGGQDEGAVVASHEDEVPSLLDLARAYIEMGDTERARKTLEEVLRAGDDYERQQAQTLLNGL